MKSPRLLLLLVAAILAASCASQTLTDLLIEKENEAKQLAAELLRLHNDGLCNSISCADSTTCDVLACAGDIQEKTCAESYGSCAEGYSSKRNLDFTQSVIRTISETPSTMKDDTRYDVCLSRGMDDDFIALNGGAVENGDKSLKWQYVGFPSGAYRIYPGVSQEECGSYDPRLRPWYAAATSGPKDVVLVVDVSGSMANQNRLELTKEAVKTVLTTLTISDHVAVVTFSSNAQQLCVGSCGTLLQATDETLEELKNKVDGLDASGETNFEAAIEVAFDILSGTAELTSNCHTAILFMTDGQITKGEEGSRLIAFMERRNNNLSRPATFFTYSLGAGADDDVPKQLACATEGVWAPVQDGGNLRSQMASFYNYYTLLSSTTTGFDVTWVEPYEDATGAGQLTTASVAVYGETADKERILVGVIGVDLLTEDINEVEPNYQNLLSQLAARSNTCEKPAIDECALKAFREIELESSSALFVSSSTSRLCGDEPTNCPSRDVVCPTGPTSSSSNIPTAQNGLICLPIDKEFDAEDAACDSCASNSSGIGAGAIVGIIFAVLIGVALIYVAYMYLSKPRHSTYTTNDRPPATAPSAPDQPPSYSDVI